MTLSEFQRLVPRAQLLVTMTQGSYLARRWEEEEGPVSLYHVAGAGRDFFVELGYAASRNEIVVLRSFGSAWPLEDYAHYVRLPEW